MKMGFLLKNNARKRMGEKRSAQKGGGRSAQKRERKRSAQKGREKGLQNSRILKRMAGWAEIRKF